MASKLLQRTLPLFPVLSLFALLTARLAIATPLPVDSESSPPENNDEDIVALVSGFYGPGAFLSWYLCTLSTIIDRLSTAISEGPDSAASDRRGSFSRVSDQPDGDAATYTSSFARALSKPRMAHILGLDLNFISSMVYPSVAAVSVIKNLLRSDWSTTDPEIASRIAAPLAVLRVWLGLGMWLLLAWVIRLQTLSMTRLRYRIMSVLVFFIGQKGLSIAMKYNPSLGTSFYLADWLPAMISFSSLPLGWIGFLMAFYVNTLSKHNIFALSVVVVIWVLGSLAEGSLSNSNNFLLWLAMDGEGSQLQETPIFAMYSLSNMTGHGARLQARDLKDYLLALVAAVKERDWKKYSSQCVVWMSVDQMQWILFKMKTDPGRYLDAWGDIYVLVLILWGLFTFVGFLALLWPTGTIIIRMKNKKGASGDLTKLIAGVCVIVLLYWKPYFLADYIMVMLTIAITRVFRLVIPLIRIDLMLPCSGANWTDLDQMAALIVNGCLPVIWSIARVFSR